ncbi:MAG: PRTRC system ThiF family protein [Chloroflexi bacterium]|nr:MAG: PRTRC system ThiF family protein [Chloroflexota bacterium]
MRDVYHIPANWLDEAVRVLLVGVGGNGSEMLDALARLHLSLVAMGHPAGLHVTAIDPDTVTEANIVRQRFYPAEIGQNKALTAIQRMNIYFGLDWDAMPVALDADALHNTDLVIGCVDNVAARNRIADFRDCALFQEQLYLDLGNGEHSGQIVLGHLACPDDAPIRLPIVQDLFPEIIEHEEHDEAPSCSAEESLQRQGFGINRTLATHSANLLWHLFTQGHIDHHGYLIDTRAGSVAPLRIDEQLWASLNGHHLDSTIARVAA